MGSYSFWLMIASPLLNQSWLMPHRLLAKKRSTPMDTHARFINLGWAWVYALRTHSLLSILGRNLGAVRAPSGLRDALCCPA